MVETKASIYGGGSDLKLEENIKKEETTKKKRYELGVYGVCYGNGLR